MRLLHIKNYRKWQKHKTTNPPWIRLYVKLLTDRDFLKLDVRHRYLYVCLLLLASENYDPRVSQGPNSVPHCLNDVSYLSQRCSMNVSASDISALISSGLIITSRSTKYRQRQSIQSIQSISDSSEAAVPAPEAPPPPQVVPLNGRKSRMLTEWPEGFMFNESHERLAAGYGLNVRAELANFRDKAIAKGWMNKDWNAAFRTWLTKAHEFKHGRLV